MNRWDSPGSTSLVQQVLGSLDVVSALLQDVPHVSQLSDLLPDLVSQVLQLSRRGWHLHGQNLVSHQLDALQVRRIL